MMSKKIVDEIEKKYLLDWIYNNKFNFNSNNVSKNRYYLQINHTFPKLFFDLKKRIIINEKIKQYKDETFYFGDLISYIENGGKVHRHIDPTIKNYDHCRYNVFLSIPEKGGMPIYNNVIQNVSEGEYIKCLSSSVYHESQEVYGNKPRIMISYGFFINREKKYEYK